MSSLGLPPASHELKFLVPFLQRADEVKQQHPIIAYWCGYHAAQQGIAAQAKDSQSREFLFALLDLLEQMKREIGPTDAIDNEAASCAYVENFALRVFLLADTEDRKGNATRATAKKFMAAANFLEVLNVFPRSEVSDSIDEKIRYAKWKAADISKAFRDGKKPTPGPATPSVSEADPTDQSSNVRTNAETSVPVTHATTEAKSVNHPPRSVWVSEELEGQPSPTSVTPPLTPPKSLGATPITPSLPSGEVDPSEDMVAATPPIEPRHQPNQPSYSPPPFPSAPPYIPSAGGYESVPALPTIPHLAPPPPVPVPAPSMFAPQGLTPSLVVKVQKHCRFAISALDYEDAEQAKKELRAALALLGA